MQTAVRGYLTRRQFYKNMISQHYIPKSKVLSESLFAYRLAKLSAKMTIVMAHQKASMQKFIANIDKNLEATELLFRNIRLDESVMRKVEEQKSAEESKVDWVKVEAKVRREQDNQCRLVELVRKIAPSALIHSIATERNIY